MEIGTSLWRHIKCGGIHEYKCIGIRQYEKDTFYELEDQACTHGWKCQVLVGGKLDALRYISMINDDEDEPQEYWHTDHNFFRLRKEQAELDLIRVNLDIVKKNFEKAQAIFEREKASLAKYEELAKIAIQKLKE